MHSTREAKITSPIFSLKDGYLKAIPLCVIAGGIGVGIAAFLAISGSSGGLARFLNIYLVNFCFLLSISLGALFFTIIFHLTRAGWSVAVRRIFEFWAACVVPLFILFLPILLVVLSGDDSIYPWVKWGYSTHDLEEARIIASSTSIAELPPIEALKASYLSPKWFGVRMVACFVCWAMLVWCFVGTSLKQDRSGESGLTLKMQFWAPLSMILFAVTIVFSSFDLEMSLSPLWFSTMFPVYFFAGAAGASLATVALTSYYLQMTGRVTDEITTDHYHDLAKLMFGFVVFWGYIAFSQFLLIWYANIPEETFWYNIRINRPGWNLMSLFLVVGHLFIPFFLIMGRTARRNKRFVAAVAIFLLMMHWVDHYWLVMPLFDAGNHASHIDGGKFSETFNALIDIPCAAGMVAIYIAFFCLIARDRPLVPTQDPRLGESLNHIVH
jgi:hypothetical protein